MTSAFFIVLLYSLTITVGVFLMFFGYRYIINRMSGKLSGRKYVKVRRIHQGPFSGESFLVFDLPEQAAIRISIQDNTEQEIAVLLEEDCRMGELVIRVDTTKFPNGQYYFELIAPGQRIQRKFSISNV
ncbi:MAG: hypothetical protein ACK40M_14330 [Flavobacteriales bacterium]